MADSLGIQGKVRGMQGIQAGVTTARLIRDTSTPVADPLTVSSSDFSVNRLESNTSEIRRCNRNINDS